MSIEALYSAAVLLGSSCLFPVLPLKRRMRERLPERYGFWGLDGVEVVWFHGASVGEINGLLPIIDGYRRHFPGVKILVSATTVTGLKRAEKFADFVRLLPFDSTLWLQKALAKLKIRAFIFGETELWPTLISYLSFRNVPLYLVNGRISDYSFRSYRILKPFLQNTLKKLNFIFASDFNSLERFIFLGVHPNSITVTGNAKYDVRPSIASKEAATALKKRFFADDAPVLVLGSIHPGEEIWLEELAAMGEPPINVIAAPRHKEKFDYFASKLEALKLRYKRWSRNQISPENESGQERIVLLDTLGDLESVYSFADLSFVGGTLVDIGGHNPLEPAMYGSCVALGPHRKNVNDIVKILQEKNAVHFVQSASDIRAILAQLKKREDIFAECGKRAHEVWRAHAGASEKIMAKLINAVQQ